MEIRLINPQNILSSIWAPTTNMKNLSFQSLKLDIEFNGGNLVPIKVRPLLGVEGKYEIVFGHRRHKACQELGFDVLAVVQAICDKRLVAEMDMENRCREDWHPFRRGAFFNNALERGLFSSLRNMAEELGISGVKIARVLAIARLSKEVISAFPRASDIRESWGRKLGEKLMRDPDFMLARAKELTVMTKKLPAARVFGVLTK